MASGLDRHRLGPASLAVRTHYRGRNSALSLPVEEAFMMLFDQHLPMIARQKSDPLPPNARGVERHLRSGLAIDVGSSIDGVSENLVDGVIAGVDPADLGVRTHLQRELVALVAQPQPNPSR